MVRLLALDLDGTLLEKDHMHISERTVKILRSAANRGIYVVPTSGRTLGLFPDVLRQLDCVRYAITANGAAVLDVRTGEPVFTSLLSVNQSAKLLRLFEETPWLSGEFYCGGRSYLTPRAQEYLENAFYPPFWAYIKTLHTRVESLSFLEGYPLEKVGVNPVPEEREEELREKLKEIGPFEMVHTGPKNLELNAPGTSKAEGLRALCRFLGILPEEVAAFGDGGNDVEMLRWAGTSFAMANAPEEVKAAARRVAPSNEEEGVAKMAEELLKIEMPQNHSALIHEMTLWFQKDRANVNHFLKVLGYAREIGELERLDPASQHILETAAIVHDIGIRPAREKYGSDAGPYQQKEGPAPARDMLEKLGYDPAVIDRVCWLVAHHHTYTDLYGADYQILVEADFLVNLDEGNASWSSIHRAREKIFRTSAGLFFLDTLFPAPANPVP